MRTTILSHTRATITKKETPKMTVFIECGVLVADLAKHMKMRESECRDECLALGATIGHDWAGRPVVSPLEAYGVASGTTRAGMEHDRKWSAFIADSKRWEADRLRVYHETFTGVAADANRKGRAGPAVHAEATEKARRAGQNFERKHPAPNWNGKKQTLSWLDDDERDKLSAGVA